MYVCNALFKVICKYSGAKKCNGREKIAEKATIGEDNAQSEPTLSLDNSFNCKDVVLGEYACNSCKYTTYKKWQMLSHIKKKHQIRAKNPPATQLTMTQFETETQMEVGANEEIPWSEISSKIQVPKPISPISNLKQQTSDLVQKPEKVSEHF